MLTSKQRACLRKQANNIDTIFQIGKDGISENQLKQIEEALVKRELIKLRVLETALMSAREACDAVCQGINAEPVQAIGTRFVIYKRNEKEPKIVLE